MTRYASLLFLAVLGLYCGSGLYAGPWSDAFVQKKDEQPVQRTQQLLYFHSKTCAPCQRETAEFERLKKSGWTFATWGESKPAFIMLVDGDRHPDMVQKYHVTAYPSFVLVVDGEPVDGLVGFQTAEQIAGVFNGYDPNLKTAVKTADKSGTINVSQSMPLAFRAEDGAVFTVESVTGRYVISGDMVTITITGKLPKVSRK